MTGASTPGLEEVARAKQAVRERVWALLERERAARFPGATGRIPNFAGAPAAAARLASLPSWRAARVLKSNPDAPQLPVRAQALADGKLLYMAVPRLTDERPFILLDPGRLEVPARRAASSDLEFALLVEAGLIGTDTVVATTVHPLQVLEEPLPETGHEFRLDVVVAGEEVITCRRARRPKGLLWEHLDPAKIGRHPRPGRPSTRPRRRLDRHDGAPREVWTVPQWGTQAAV